MKNSTYGEEDISTASKSKFSAADLDQTKRKVRLVYYLLEV